MNDFCFLTFDSAAEASAEKGGAESPRVESASAEEEGPLGTPAVLLPAACFSSSPRFEAYSESHDLPLLSGTLRCKLTAACSSKNCVIDLNEGDRRGRSCC